MKARSYTLPCVLLALSLIVSGCGDDDNSNPTQVSGEDPETPDAGYTLFAPLGQGGTYLIDEEGAVVQSWQSDYSPGLSAYLLPDSTLLRTASLERINNGTGGRIERFDWDGDLIWEFDYRGDEYLLHHDIEMLSSGNILAIAREFKTASEAIAAGRDPSLIVDDAVWPDKIIEIEPISGAIVWEWRIWDHLVQDHDPGQANYGVVSAQPGKIDINYVMSRLGADWTHCNGVDYNAELDQILVTVHHFGEIWIIDHGTTTTEAAGPAGDLLYRWGNPQTYGHGGTVDQKMFGPHDGRWITNDCPGAGDILIFNNGQGRLDGNYSSIEQITPPEDGAGGYVYAAGTSFGPSTVGWTYVADSPTSFFADHISGAQRLPDGITLICDGPAGRFFEVTTAGDVAWEYVNPYIGTGEMGNEVFRATRYYLGD